MLTDEHQFNYVFCNNDALKKKPFKTLTDFKVIVITRLIDQLLFKEIGFQNKSVV